MSKPTSARAARYQKLVRDTAREFNVKTSSEIAARVASYRLLREQLQANLLSGKDVAVDEMLRVDEALQTAMPAKNIKVDIEIVEGYCGICSNCKFEHRVPFCCPACGVVLKPEVPIARGY
jgi:hypothetical protein